MRSSIKRLELNARSPGPRPSTRALRTTMGRLKNTTVAVSPDGSARRPTSSSRCRAAVSGGVWDCAASAVPQTTIRQSAAIRAKSVDFRHELPSGNRSLVVVGMLFRAARQRDLRALDLLVRNLFQDVGDRIEASAFLVIGSDDVPGRD